MKILNLVYPEKSEIQYKISKFPDGQQQILIVWDEKIKDEVTINARLNNFLDLELIICTVKSLNYFKTNKINLYVPYFLGSRSDRKFGTGSNNYLKDIICPIINSLKFSSVMICDPHSDVLEACLNNFSKFSNFKLVESALFKIHAEVGKVPYIDYINNNIVLISPDAGASKKIYSLVDLLKYKGEIVTCSKERDNSGKLTNVIVPYGKYNATFPDKDIIIIDDICDGGATFINIAKVLKEEFPKNKIYLIVTHGIFSKGFEELSKYFDGIYCTNSYQDINNELVKQLNVF